jgi:hypothetical protein
MLFDDELGLGRVSAVRLLDKSKYVGDAGLGTDAAENCREI